MSRFFESPNFEHYLQQDVEKRKMVPSDRIWSSIRHRLHKDKRRKWPELFIVGMVTFLLHTVGLFVFKPNYAVLKAPFNAYYSRAAFHPLPFVLNGISMIRTLPSEASAFSFHGLYNHPIHFSKK